MKTYKVKLKFTNLDNSLYTDSQASMTFDVEADDYTHAYLLAERLKNTFDADEFYIQD